MEEQRDVEKCKVKKCLKFVRCDVKYRVGNCKVCRYWRNQVKMGKVQLNEQYCIALHNSLKAFSIDDSYGTSY